MTHACQVCLFLSVTGGAGFYAGNTCIYLHVGNTGLSHGRADGLHGRLYAVQELREISARSRHFALLRQHESRQRHAVRIHDRVFRRHCAGSDFGFWSRERFSEKREVLTETDGWQRVSLYKVNGNVSDARYRESESRSAIGVFVPLFGFHELDEIPVYTRGVCNHRTGIHASTTPSLFRCASSAAINIETRCPAR